MKRNKKTPILSTIHNIETTLLFLREITKEIEQGRKYGKKIKLWRGTKAYIDAALKDAKGQINLAITEYKVSQEELQAKAKKSQA